MSRTFLVAALCLAASATTVQAKPLRLSRTFSPSPLITDEITINVDTGARISDMGYRDCGDSFSTREPAFTFELTEPLTELRLRLELDNGFPPPGASAVVVFPNGGYACSEKSEIFLKTWPKGSYKVFLHGSSSPLTSRFRFELPTRSRAAVTSALATLRAVALTDRGPTPAVFDLAAAPAAEAQDLGIACAAAKQRIMPLASLELAKDSTYQVAADKLELFAVTADQRCAELRGDVNLPAGRHVVWAKLPADSAPRAVELMVDDVSRPFVPAEAPRKAVGALDEPLVVPGKVRAAQAWGLRYGLCSGSARVPDFYLTSDQPLQKVELSLLWARAPQAVHVYGPLEESTLRSLPRCFSSQLPLHSFETFEGTYAVWVGGDKQAVGSDYHVLLRRTDVAIDPLTNLAPIPAELALGERALRNHYPYFNGKSAQAWHAAFTKAPDQLFAYARADFTNKDSGVAIKKDEPLMLGWSTQDDSLVHRHDGSSTGMPTRLLTVERPAKVWLPSTPTVPTAESISTAIDLSGPEDAKAIATYRKVDDTFTGCLGKYLEKHDPTWGKGHDVYRISRGGRVSNVGEAIGARGAKKCGEAKLERAGKKLLGDLAKTRTKRFKSWLDAVRRRFGA